MNFSLTLRKCVRVSACLWSALSEGRFDINEQNKLNLYGTRRNPRNGQEQNQLALGMREKYELFPRRH